MPETILNVRLQPRASRNAVVGFVGDVLRVRVTAPPVGGEANEALVTLLAGKLRIGRGRVTLMKGHRSRNKTVRIEGLSEAEIAALI